MLYVFYGTDISSAVKKAHGLVDGLRAKKPDAAFVRMDAQTWSGSALESHLGGQGLFSNKYIVLIDRVTENAEAKEMLPGFVSALQESANIFIVVEGKVSADLKKTLTKHAQKIVECEKNEKSTRSGSAVTDRADFNIFALGDALGSRDALKAWALYRQAIEIGLEPENITGTLFWQAKSIVVAGSAVSATASGLSPFVYGKSKRYAGNYSANELRMLINQLVVLYHDAHRGVRDFELSLERLLLTL